MSDSKQKPTALPWVYDAHYPDRVYSSDVTGSMVLIAGGDAFNYVYRSDAESEANAQLAFVAVAYHHRLLGMVEVIKHAVAPSSRAVLAEKAQDLLREIDRAWADIAANIAAVQAAKVEALKRADEARRRKALEPTRQMFTTLITLFGEDSLTPEQKTQLNAMREELGFETHKYADTGREFTE